MALFGVMFVLNFVKIGPRVCKVIGDTYTYTQFYGLEEETSKMLHLEGLEHGFVWC